MRKPINPRLGTMNSIRTHPWALVAMWSIRPFARAKLRDGAQVLPGTSIEVPKGLQFAVDLARHDLWLAHGQLEALAAHLFDEDRQRELTGFCTSHASGRLMSTTRSDTLPTSVSSRDFTIRASVCARTPCPPAATS